MAAFRLRLAPGTPGSFALAARATDARGVTQPKSKTHNAVHTVTVAIE
jgi:hypothetical protein